MTPSPLLLSRLLPVLGSIALVACMKASSGPTAPQDVALDAGGQQDGGDAATVVRVIPVQLLTCTATGPSGDPFAPISDRIVVRVTGGDIPADGPVVQVFESGTVDTAGVLFVDGVPAGDGVRIDVVACTADELASWVGFADQLSVVADTLNSFEVPMMPIGQMACPGLGPDAQPTLKQGQAFAGLVRQGDEAWILGGFDSYFSATRVATATEAISVFAPATSEFSSLPDANGLSEPRGVMLADVDPTGGIRIVGGTSQIQFMPAGGMPPFWAPPGGAPSCALELYDAVAQSSSCRHPIELPAMPAVAEVRDGVYALVGGSVEGGAHGEPSDSAYILTDTAIQEIPLPSGRFGATVAPLTASQVLVWGGNRDGDPASTGLLLDVDTATAEVVDTAGYAGPVPIFASSHYLGTSDSGAHRVLVVGGTDIVGPDSYSIYVFEPRAELVEVDLGGSPQATVTPIELAEPGDYDFQRAMASLVALGGPQHDLLWFGGFTAFVSHDACPDTDDCLQKTLTRFSVDASADPPTLSKLGPSLDLPFGALGAGAIALQDGAWLIVGGFSTVGDPAPFGAGQIDPDGGLVQYTTELAGLCSM